MLQRIQTVFLVLVALFMFLTLLFPLWTTMDSPDHDLTLTAWKFTNGEQEITFPYYLVAALAIASLVVTVIEITKYTNRLLQMKLGALNSLLMAGTLGLSVYFYRDLVKEFNVMGEFGLSLWFPAIAMIFNVFANRYIRKDEKLVRSADRIR